MWEYDVNLQSWLNGTNRVCEIVGAYVACKDGAWLPRVFYTLEEAQKAADGLE